MSFLDATPKQTTKSSGSNNYPYFQKYNTKHTIILLNSLQDEDQIQYIKYHPTQIKNDKGKAFPGRVLCPDYKSENAENATCPLCIHYNSLSDQEVKDLDWTSSLKSKSVLPMTILVVDNSDPENIKYWKKVRLSTDYDKNFIIEKLKEYKEAKGKDLDTRGLMLTCSRGPEPEGGGRRPAAIGELELGISGLEVFDLETIEFNTEAYTMQQVLDDHFIQDEETIEELMSEYK